MKLISLISAGIDSPVSSYLAENELVFLHFRQKNSDIFVKKIIDVLLKNGVISHRLIVVNHDRIISNIKNFCNKKEMCVYCKASMLVLAETLAEKFGCKAVVTGDNLGQVASQTLPNLRSEESLIEIPVIRPLIGLDKNEIIDLAKKIGTYSISTNFKNECMYAPKHPVTGGCTVKHEIKDVVKQVYFVEYEIEL